MNHKITVARSGKMSARNALLFTATCTCGYGSGPWGLSTAQTAGADHVKARAASALAALPECPGSGSVPPWMAAGPAPQYGTCLECLRRVPRDLSSHALAVHARIGR